MHSSSQQAKSSSSGADDGDDDVLSLQSFFEEVEKRAKVSSWFIVAFRALVTPCIPHCEPVRCGEEGKQSYGRRRRREEERGGGRGWEVEGGVYRGSREEVGSGGERVFRRKREGGEDLLLANAIHILDKLEFLPEHDDDDDEDGDHDEHQQQNDSEGPFGCGTLVHASLVAAVFLLLQARIFIHIVVTFLEIISIKNFPNIFRCSVTIAQFPGSPSGRLASFAQLEQPPGFCSGEGPPLLCRHRLEDRLLLDDVEYSWPFLDIVHIYAALMDRRRVKTIITSSDHFEAKNSGGCDHQGQRRRPGGRNGKKGRYPSENMRPRTFRAWSHVLLCCKSYFGTIVRCQNQWLCIAIHPSEMQVRMCRCA